MKPIQEAVANGTIHKDFDSVGLGVMKLTNIHEPDHVCWAIVRKVNQHKVQPIGNSEEMFQYDTEEEAWEELKLLRLWCAEGVGNA